MYIICVYDVDAKRCVKLMKILRKYLFHVQNSVFEGELTPSKFNTLEKEIKIIMQDSDSVKFYFSYNNKQIYSKSLGKAKNANNIIL